MRAPSKATPQRNTVLAQNTSPGLTLGSSCKKWKDTPKSKA